ncbi:hypothetical protein AMTR_s00175p00049630 [Amborella trichopoda]|uniref:Patatin n=2 Tax=Amborella trichopoda TaxID=13333 RepID=U5D3H6_AMBTC|nr:hypothetical protein AMTR_s00175p00049630 [Amborella trichopoda]
MEEPSIDTDKLSYEIFSILESKFLFGYDDQKLWIPKDIVETSPAKTEQEPATAIKSQRGKVCVLSIDGCGMRGIIPGKALAYLEQAIKNKSGDPDARIADYFDVAAGSSIGGLFTAMLFTRGKNNRPLFRADETWRFLVEKGERMFGFGGGFLKKLFKGGTASATAGIERIAKEMFSEEGRNLTLKDTLKPVLVPCYDLSSSAPFLFSRADALETSSFDFNLWEVCRATMAHPARFEPIMMRSVDGQTRCLAVDGGLAMNNPTAAAITHVLHNKQEFPFVRGVEDLLVLSLGSGQEEGSYEYERVRKWRLKEWAKPLLRIVGEGVSDMVDHAVSMAFGQSRSSNYVRVQANGLNTGNCAANMDDDPGPSNAKKLIKVADDMLKQKNVESVLFGGKRIGEQLNYEKLDWFAGELVVEHQRRSCRIAPTVAFKQATPRTSSFATPASS